MVGIGLAIVPEGYAADEVVGELYCAGGGTVYLVGQEESVCWAVSGRACGSGGDYGIIYVQVYSACAVRQKKEVGAFTDSQGNACRYTRQVSPVVNLEADSRAYDFDGYALSNQVAIAGPSIVFAKGENKGVLRVGDVPLDESSGAGYCL